MKLTTSNWGSKCEVKTSRQCKKIIKIIFGAYLRQSGSIYIIRTKTFRSSAHAVE